MVIRIYVAINQNSSFPLMALATLYKSFSPFLPCFCWKWGALMELIGLVLPPGMPGAAPASYRCSVDEAALEGFTSAHHGITVSSGSSSKCTALTPVTGQPWTVMKSWTEVRPCLRKGPAGPRLSTLPVPEPLLTHSPPGPETICPHVDSNLNVAFTGLLFIERVCLHVPRTLHSTT